MPSSSEGAALSWRLSGSSIVHSSAPLRGEAPSLSERDHHARLAQPSLDTRLADRRLGRGGSGHRLSQGLGLARLTLAGHGARRERSPFMPGPRHSCTHSCWTRPCPARVPSMPARPSRTPWPARAPVPALQRVRLTHQEDVPPMPPKPTCRANGRRPRRASHKREARGSAPERSERRTSRTPRKQLERAPSRGGALDSVFDNAQRLYRGNRRGISATTYANTANVATQSATSSGSSLSIVSASVWWYQK
jgi:hypothetical protein